MNERKNLYIYNQRYFGDLSKLYFLRNKILFRFEENGKYFKGKTY